MRPRFGPLVLLTALLLAAPLAASRAQVRWEREVPGTWAYGAHALADGGLVVAGAATASATRNDLLAVRLTAMGDSAWAFRDASSGSGDDEIRAMLPVGSGGADGFVAGGFLAAAVNTDAILVRVGSDGRELWRDVYNGAGAPRDQFTHLLTTADAIYAAGESGGDALLVKYSLTGTRLWAKTYNGPGNHADYAIGLHPGADGGAVVVVSATAMYLSLAQRISPVVLRYAADGSLAGTHVFDHKVDPNGALDGGLRPAASVMDDAGTVFILNGLDLNTPPELLAVNPDGTQRLRVALDLQPPSRVRGVRPYGLLLHPNGDLVVSVEQTVDGTPSWSALVTMVVAAVQPADGAVRWVNRRSALVPGHVTIGPGDALFAVSDLVFTREGGQRDSTAALVRRIEPSDGQTTWSVRTPDGFNAASTGGSHAYRQGVARLTRGAGSTLYLTYRRYTSSGTRNDPTHARLRTVQFDTDVTSNVLTSVGPASEPAAVLRFDGAAPNPVRDAAVLRFALDRAVPVTLRLFDVTGRHVATLLDGAMQSPGEHAVAWAPGELAPGVYLCRLDAGGAVHSALVTRVR